MNKEFQHCGYKNNKEGKERQSEMLVVGGWSGVCEAVL
jgi:hypothetical protein